MSSWHGGWLSTGTTLPISVYFSSVEVIQCPIRWEEYWTLCVINVKGLGKKCLWPILRYYSNICQEGLMKTTKGLKTDDVSAEIETGQLQKTHQTCYWCVNLFGGIANFNHFMKPEILAVLSCDGIITFFFFETEFIAQMCLYSLCLLHFIQSSEFKINISMFSLLFQNNSKFAESGLQCRGPCRCNTNIFSRFSLFFRFPKELSFFFIIL